LTDECLKFFQDNHFSVGISIDGPEELHNKLRKDEHGRGTFRQVEQSIKLSQQAQILSGIICCVSKTNCPYPKDIFEFFVGLGTKDIKFLQVQGRDNQGQPLPDSVNPLEFANFLLEVMRLWLKLDDPSVTVVQIDSIIKSILGQEVRDCMFMGECHRYFTVYPDGQVYGCDSLPRVEQLAFGHISEGVEKLLSSAYFQCFRSRMAQIQSQCHRCQWFRICHGGCLQDYYPDIFHPQTRNLFCPGLKRIYKKITQMLNEYGLIPN